MKIVLVQTYKHHIKTKLNMGEKYASTREGLQSAANFGFLLCHITSRNECMFATLQRHVSHINSRLPHHSSVCVCVTRSCVCMKSFLTTSKTKKNADITYLQCRMQKSTTHKHTHTQLAKHTHTQSSQATHSEYKLLHMYMYTYTENSIGATLTLSEGLLY